MSVMADAFGKMRLRVGYNLQYNKWRKEGSSGEVDFVCDRGANASTSRSPMSLRTRGRGRGNLALLRKFGHLTGNFC